MFYLSFSKLDAQKITDGVTVNVIGLPVIFIAGYYLDAGDSVNDTAIFIVPEGQTPDVNIHKVM